MFSQTDASVSQKSTTISLGLQIQEIAFGNASPIDKIFPLFDQMAQKTSLSVGFLSILAIYTLLQFATVPLWIYSHAFLNETPLQRTIYLWIFKIFTWMDPTDTETNYITYTLVDLCVLLASVIWFVSMIIYYQKVHNYNKILLYISTLILDLIDSVFLIPSAQLASNGILRCLIHPNMISIAQTVVALFATLGFALVLGMSLSLKARSVVLTNLMFPLFDASPIIIYTSLNVVSLLISSLVTIFDDWFIVTIIFLHMMVTIMLIYRHIYLPFYEIWRNCVSTSIAIMTLVFDFVALIANVATIVPYFLVLLTGSIAFVVSLLVSSTWFHKRVKRIKRELSYSDEKEKPSEFIETLGLEKNEDKAVMYIVVGLSTISDYFIDGSLTDYMVQYCATKRNLSVLLQCITFFPSEYRKMNILFAKLASNKSLSLVERFLIYQVYRIKTRRLVSDTKESFELISKLATESRKCEANLTSFWNQETCNFTYLTKLSKDIINTRRLYQEAIENNPNNPRLASEYSHFLINCECNFEEAILEHMKSERIGDGKNFNVDVSFRSLVRKFPRYLKDQVLDTKGKRIIRRNDGSGSKSQSVKSSQNSSLQSSGADMSLDHEHEESVGKVIIKNSKLLLAFHHAIEEKRPLAANLLIYVGIISFIVSALSYCILFIYTKSILPERTSTIYNLVYMSDVRLYTDMAIFTIYSAWAELHQYITNEAAIGDVKKLDRDIEPIIRFDLDLEHRITDSISHSKNSLHNLISRLVEIASSGVDVYSITGDFINGSLDTHVCTNGKPSAIIQGASKCQLSYMNMVGSRLTTKIRDNNIFETDEYCEILSNSFNVATSMQSSLDDLKSYEEQERNKVRNIMELFIDIVAPILIVCSFVPFTLVVCHYIYTTNKALKILLNVPQNIKDEAKEPLCIERMQEETPEIANLGSSSTFWIPFVLYYIGSIIVTVIFIIFIKKLESGNDDISHINQWYYWSAIRATAAAEAGNDALQLLLFAGGLHQDIISVEELTKIANRDLATLSYANDELTKGSESTLKSIGFDAILDELQLTDSCLYDIEPTTLHDTYACASLSQQINVFKGMALDIIRQPLHYHGKIDDEISYNIYHILPYHLWTNDLRYSERLIELSLKEESIMMTLATIFVVVGICVATLEVLFATMVRQEIINNYKMLMVLFQHIPPSHIVSNKEILHYFMNKNTEKETMSVAKSIIHNSSEAIMITGTNLIIETLNPALTQALGYTPDQLLGQPITNIMHEEVSTKIEQQINMMINKQSSSTYEENIELVSDSALTIPFKATIIAMNSENTDEVVSFVFILKNITELLKKQKDAEEAKAKSEKLLYQILPKDIVVRLNSGERDISFTIPHATIFFIDIVKFSDYAATLTPTEIMANLSFIFDAFDKNVSKYPTITKIKLIGDVYMAAAGLFGKEGDDPATHAEEAVKCALDCLKTIEEVNVRLNSSLEVRIGVNTDGPLIGGVLGTDKPTFDIIGDPINVAARLQSTDVPGRVQVSKATKELIEHLDFDIEARGEVYLKGKGNQMTYLVSHAVTKISTTESFALNFQTMN